MATKLGQYNDALLHIGQERLASLAEASTARYALDDAWDSALRYCLEQGFWNFAMRAIQADHSTSFTPTFGFAYAFTKPTDFIRLYQLSANEELEPPLFDMVDEPNYWFANFDPIFAKYISSDTAYGGDLSIWPETFAVYHALYLATRICKRVSGSFPSEEMKRDLKRAQADASSKDALNEPPKFPPLNTWVRSRSGGTSRGSRWNGQTR